MGRLPRRLRWYTLPRTRGAAQHVVRGLERRWEEAREAAEHAVAEARRQGQLIAMVSHEMREPLNGLLGMARLLAETPLDPEQKRLLDAVLGSSEMLLTLVNDLLDLSRVEQGRLELARTTFALHPFLERVRAMLEYRARRRGLDFTIHTAPGTPELVRGDPARLRQVLLNLLGNALKFTERGRVTLTVQPAPAPAGRIGLRFEIRDTGMGIPPEMLPRLGRAFVQGEAGRGMGGSGLGLMIAHRLVSAMNGSLSIDSRPGKGTRVRATVCLEPGRAGSRDRPDVRAALAGAQLLIVDGDQRARRTIARHVRGWGVTAAEAAHLEEGWAVLQEAADRGQPFDIVLVDRDVVEGDIEGFAGRVRADGRVRQAILVLLAAAGLRGDAARAEKAGFDAFLPKPLAPDLLQQSLVRLRRSGSREFVTAHSMRESRPRQLNVLIADDNPVNVRLLQIMLEGLGHRVRAARNGQEALEAVQRYRFDLVLLDLQMPVMGGLEAARRIRALPDPERASVPIVAVTADITAGRHPEWEDVGMNAYLCKPVSKDKLREMVARCVAGSVP